MRKGWLVFFLVLVISGQLLVLSAFHDVEANGFVIGNSVIGVSKWNYDQGSVHVSITPIVQNTTGHVELVFPNGTSIVVSSQYSFNLQLPRTGDVLGNGAISGPLALSQSQPLNVIISQNVGNITDQFNYLRGISSSSLLPIDLYLFAVYGEAQVSVSGYGIAL